MIKTAGIELVFQGRMPKNADLSSQYLLTRLLLGAATVKIDDLIIKQNVDYSVISSRLQTKSSSVAIAAFLNENNIQGGVNRFIKVTIIDNRKFYNTVLGEFINFFVQKNKHCHTAAFIFIYRTLEHMSYTIPLIYTSTNRDYVGSFNDLKKILNRDDGELKFFNKFLCVARFIDPTILDTTYEFKFSSKGPYIKTKSLFGGWVSSDDSIYTLELKFKNVGELLAIIRNRFFHFKTGEGQSNITLDNVGDTDNYFKILNEAFVSFLSIIVLRTISSRYGY